MPPRAHAIGPGTKVSARKARSKGGDNIPGVNFRPSRRTDFVERKDVLLSTESLKIQGLSMSKSKWEFKCSGVLYFDLLTANFFPDLVREKFKSGGSLHNMHVIIR